MIRFIKQPELIKKMGNESRKWVVELFDEQIVFKKTLEIYNTGSADYADYSEVKSFKNL
jgi:hypothetical protein